MDNNGLHGVTKDKNCYIFYNGYWWKLAKSKDGRKTTFHCLNEAGGGFDLKEKQFASIYRKYKLALAAKRSELDWKGTCVYDEKYKTGWLDRQGKFYGCDYRYHSEQAELIHESSERALEMQGWIKLTYSWGNKENPIILFELETKPTKKTN